MADKEKSILVVAINLCTSSFGYAYSFKEDYKRNPTEVSLNQDDLELPRFPTAMLLNPEKEFIASGDSAGRIFSNLDPYKEYYNCFYYFSEVKLSLQDTIELSKDTKITDDKGKEILALDIFAYFIKRLKDHLLSFMETKGLPVYIEDIYWVLPMPVPFILDISSIQFMTEAANKAGILTEQLKICSEQEVVFMFCQHEPATNLMGNPCTKPILSFSPGTKYIIIDLEGIPADIYCYQKQSDGTLKEFHRPKGGIRKGSKVNEAFDRIMIKIFGNECFRSFKERCEEDCSYMYWEFANKTMMVKLEKETDRIRIRLPPDFLEILEGYGGAHILDNSKYAQKVHLMRDKLTMKTDVFLNFFRKPISMILEQLRVLMMKENFSDISLILGVGAFSKFPMMYEAIRNAFPEKIVIFPEDNGIAILKGAVMFGHAFTPRDVSRAEPSGIL